MIDLRVSLASTADELIKAALAMESLDEKLAKACDQAGGFLRDKPAIVVQARYVGAWSIPEMVDAHELLVLQQNIHAMTGSVQEANQLIEAAEKLSMHGWSFIRCLRLVAAEWMRAKTRETEANWEGFRELQLRFGVTALPKKPEPQPHVVGPPPGRVTANPRARARARQQRRSRRRNR